MHDALTLVLRRLELDPPVFHADEFRDDLEPWRTQLEAAGVLQRIAASASASCPYCCDDSPRRVIFVENGQADGKRGFLSCPECGVFEVPPERLQRWTVDIRGFLSHAFAGSGAAVRASRNVRARRSNECQTIAHGDRFQAPLTRLFERFSKLFACALFTLALARRAHHSQTFGGILTLAAPLAGMICAHLRALMRNLR